MDAYDHVGDSGACHSQRAALASGGERTRPICPRCSLCPRQGKTLEQGGASAETGMLASFRFRNAAAPWFSVAALMRGGGKGRSLTLLQMALPSLSGAGQ